MDKKNLSVTARLVIALIFLVPLAGYAAKTKIISAAITGSTIDNTTIGATTPSTAVFSNLSVNGLGTGCATVISGVIGNAVYPCLQQSIGAICSTTIANNVSLTSSANLGTCSVTCPSGGAVCRAHILYGDWIQKVSAGTGVSEWVTSSSADSNSISAFDGRTAAESNGSSGGNALLGGDEYSTGTWAAGTSVVFTLNAQIASGSYKVFSAPLVGSGSSGQFQVVMESSN